jgi:hypothetical protein
MKGFYLSWNECENKLHFNYIIETILEFGLNYKPGVFFVNLSGRVERVN